MTTDATTNYENSRINIVDSIHVTKLVCSAYGKMHCAV